MEEGCHKRIFHLVGHWLDNCSFSSAFDAAEAQQISRILALLLLACCAFGKSWCPASFLIPQASFDYFIYLK